MTISPEGIIESVDSICRDSADTQYMLIQIFPVTPDPRLRSPNSLVVLVALKGYLRGSLDVSLWKHWAYGELVQGFSERLSWRNRFSHPYSCSELWKCRQNRNRDRSQNSLFPVLHSEFELARGVTVTPALLAYTLLLRRPATRRDRRRSSVKVAVTPGTTVGAQAYRRNVMKFFLAPRSHSTVLHVQLINSSSLS